MRRIGVVTGAIVLCVALGACKPPAPVEVKYDAPPQAALPDSGWTPVTLAQSGANNVGKQLERGVVHLDQDDLDGDGKPDQSTLVANAKAGLYAVDIVLSNGQHARLASGPLEKVKTKVLKRVGKGHQTRNCGYFNADSKGEVRCGPLYVEEIVLDQRAVNLFDTRTRDATYILWDGKRLRALVMDGPLTGPKRPDPQ